VRNRCNEVIRLIRVRPRHIKIVINMRMFKSGHLMSMNLVITVTKYVIPYGVILC